MRKLRTGVLLFAGVASTALISALPADATVKSGFINCTADLAEEATPTVIGLSLPLRQPSNSHVVGPAWVAKATAFAMTNVGGATNLPSVSSGLSIGAFKNVITIATINGRPDTAYGPAVVFSGGYDAGGPGDGSFYFDNDIGDAIPPVKMDGLAGHPAAPTVTYGLSLTAGQKILVTNLTPNGGVLDIVDGPVGKGGRVYAPDVTIPITSSGSTDGPISYYGAKTSLTAVLPGTPTGQNPTGNTLATTTCAPSAAPFHTTQVQTDGGPVVTSAPVVACRPSTGTTGDISDSKGWWSDKSAATTAQFGGSIKGATTYGGCVVPDQRVNNWQAAKTGAPADDAKAVTSAAIQFKGKQYGNCTQVDTLSPSGRSWNASSPTSYPFNGALQVKFDNTKVKGPQAAVGGNIVVDSSGYDQRAFFEAVGVVSKGTGVGGSLYFLAELDSSDPDVQGILACNAQGVCSGGTLAGATCFNDSQCPTSTCNNSFTPGTVFYGKGGLSIKTAGDAILSVTLP